MWSKAGSERERRREGDIACYSCRRDRQRPQCLVCLETSQDCCYPERPLKPGPKLGSLKRPRKRTLQQSDNNGSKTSSESNDPRESVETSSKAPEIPPALETTLNTSKGYAEAGALSGDGVNSMEAASDPRANIHDLSFILHPAHEAASPESKEATPPETTCRELHFTKFEQACVALGVAGTSLATIVNIYFDNMVAISLFQEPRFAQQVHDGVPTAHISALLAAIAAYAARLCPEEVKEQCATWPDEHVSLAEYFLALAFSLTDTALAECGDEPPSLRIIQALTIATHLQLTQGVRGKAWRSLGTCIRLAYELNLHLVDASPDGFDHLEVQQWSWKEEKRRLWWAIWEMDVFASTIRRTPPAIDWSQIETLLPVSDEHWFNDQPRASCFMERDPICRWKALQECGNHSPKAWFLVVNSFMKQAQVISSPRSIPPRAPCRQTDAGKDSCPKVAASPEIVPDIATQKLGTLANCLRCFMSVLPERLRYRNQYLNFEARAPGKLTSTRQHHCAVYNIYVMVQLAKLMIHRYDVFRCLGSLVKSQHGRGNEKSNSTLHQAASETDNLALAQYFEAADNILSIVTRSCDDHFRFINPFLSSTIWLAAAVQVFRQEFDQGETQRAFMRSKFEVLYMVYTQCVSWWKTHTAMEQNLEFLATQLERYREAKDSCNSRLGRLSETSFAAQSEQAPPHGKHSPQGETPNPLVTIRKLTRFVNCKGPFGGVILGSDIPSVHNTIPPDSLAAHPSPISIVNSGLGAHCSGSGLPPSDATSPTLAFTQGSSSMNELWAVDGVQLRYSDVTESRQRNHSYSQGDPSADYLDSLLSTIPNPESSFARFLAGDLDFGNDMSLDLSTNIHGLLSGHSMY
ncbi:fungal-specific transcription factor domain-containing protein [Aspergillus pseudoustus]|uniref:Fungal-specific transcription factor domain-containing protein n=1 Tax=Aspergillus pseudoustus TaxID=1810923 RepID=A0ABR4K5Q4_9EURO